MRDLLQKRKDSGFTIVEVMLVLAIGGLIILIVFLAVPALQRNSRNTQRNNDVSLIGAAIGECLSNRNGQATACDTYTSPATTGELNAYIDATKLRQLTTIGVSATAPAAAPTPDFATVNIAFGRKCDPTGATATAAGATARQVALLFNSENASGQAVARCQEV